MEYGKVVRVIDGSYSMEISKGKLIHTSGNALAAEGNWMVLASDCDLPSDNLMFDPQKNRNDTIIQSLSSDKVAFIQSRFLVSAHTCSVCPICRRVI